MKYTVSIRWTCGGYIDVYAKSAQEAFDYVEEVLGEDDLNAEFGKSEGVYIYPRSIMCDDECPTIQDENGKNYSWHLDGIVYSEDGEEEEGEYI